MGDDAPENVGQGTCDQCGSALQGAECPRCSMDEATEQKVREALAYVKGQIEVGKRNGVNLAKVEDILVGAEFMFEAGNYEDALKLVNECSEMAGDLIIQYNAFVSALRRSAKKIMDARTEGAETDEAMKFLQMAEEAMNRTDYKLGISYAVRSGEMVEGGKKKHGTGSGPDWTRGM